MAAADPELRELLDFWFDPATRPFWFESTQAFDGDLATRFGTLHARAAAGQRAHWEDTPHGCLGLVLLLDQVPRNLFRGTARAFATDGHALSIADLSVGRGDDRHLDEPERLFLYLPFEHAEDMEAQDRSVALISELTSEPAWADYARKHRDVIARFGRFPSRNAALGRESTPEERHFLETEGKGW